MRFKAYLLLIIVIIFYPFIKLYYILKEKLCMRKFNKWQKVKMTTIKDGKLKVYPTNLCPKCQNEQLVQSNYCSRCGKRLRRGYD